MICYRAKLAKNQGEQATTSLRAQRSNPWIAASAFRLPRNDGNSAENGSIIVWILIAILLFAALSFTFSQGFRVGESTVTKERAQLIASDMLDNANAIQAGVQELLINGCADTEISFDQAIVNGYSNPTSPTDESCHVFSHSGAALRWKDPMEGHSAVVNNTYIITGDVRIDGLGITANPELLLIVDDLDDTVCESVNTRMGIDDIPNDIVNGHETQFTGAYTATGIIDVSALAGKPTGCLHHNATEYIFYSTLRAR